MDTTLNIGIKEMYKPMKLKKQKTKAMTPDLKSKAVSRIF